MRFFLVALLLLVSGTAAAEDSKTDPFPLANPVTGEPGVWTPVWLQQEFLKTQASLDSCTETERLTGLVLSEQKYQLHETNAANGDLQKAVDTLKQKAAFEESLRIKADSKAENRLYWTLGFAGAAAVAVLVVVVQNVN